MKIFAISDLHLSINSPKPMDIFGGNWVNYIEEIVASWNENVTDDDIVLLSGDFSWAMTLGQAKSDLEFLTTLKGKKVLLRGNHDYWWKSISVLRTVLPPNTFAVQNDFVRFDNFLICGTRGWTIPEGKNQSAEDEKIYLREVERLKISLSAMSKVRKDDDVVIAMTHFPPFNSRYNDSKFTKLFDEYNVPIVVYGHLHGKDCRAEKVVNINNTKYYLTSCDILSNKILRLV